MGFSVTVAFIFFVCPKKMNPRKIEAGNENALFRRCFLRFLAKPSKTAIKSEHLFRISISQGLFMATLTKKMNQESYNLNLIQMIEHHVF